jgi:hypothetical protein
MNARNIPQQQFSPQGVRARISAAKNQMISPKDFKAKAFDPMAERTAQVFEVSEELVDQRNGFRRLLLKPVGFSPNILKLERMIAGDILVDE